MSNGAVCCALEICCGNQAELTVELAKVIGDEHAQNLLDWMHKEEIAFAPAAFRAVVQEIVAAVRRHDLKG
jgi:hypothetical protein